ncbi:hypothetical protein [Paraflavitalea speifideaquila]|uniref:hypothetical protein n=1 Tax=Paraflavitalea speifideaquila TaxID=3076558 RepID=UPI0028E81F16|nr:hypothetical protein [Paraflavitalea speifideiaquila]
MYFGLSTGLYKVNLPSGNKDFSYSTGTFEFVPKTEGQVWGLSSVNNQLLLAHNRGAYQVENDKISVIDDKTGFWTFKPLYNTLPSPVIIAGTYNGINFYNYNNAGFTNPVIHAQFESARYIAINKDTIWIAHPYKGLYKVAFNAQGQPFAINYQDKKASCRPTTTTCTNWVINWYSPPIMASLNTTIPKRILLDQLPWKTCLGLLP